MAKERIGPETTSKYENIYLRFKKFCEENSYCDPSVITSSTHENIILWLTEECSKGHKAKQSRTIMDMKSGLKSMYEFKFERVGNFNPEDPSKGNPCAHHKVTGFTHGYARKRKREGEKQESSRACTIEMLTAMVNFTRSEEGSALLQPVAAMETRTLISWCFFFFSRIDEALDCTWGEIKLERKNDRRSLHHELNIARKSSKMASYRLFKDFDDPPALNVYEMLLRWREFLAGQNPAYIADSAFIFPKMRFEKKKDGGRGGMKISFGQKACQTDVQEIVRTLLVECGFCVDIEDSRAFTTHMFRRGAAQYRHWFAPKRWSLSLIKYWGSWSLKSSTDSILRYLVDSEFTNDYFLNVLDPKENHKALLAEKSVTIEDGLSSLRTDMRILSENLEHLTRRRDEVSSLKYEQGQRFQEMEAREIRRQHEHASLCQTLHQLMKLVAVVQPALPSESAPVNPQAAMPREVGNPVTSTFENQQPPAAATLHQNIARSAHPPSARVPPSAGVPCSSRVPPSSVSPFANVLPQPPPASVPSSSRVSPSGSGLFLPPSVSEPSSLRVPPSSSVSPSASVPTRPSSASVPPRPPPACMPSSSSMPLRPPSASFIPLRSSASLLGVPGASGGPSMARFDISEQTRAIPVATKGLADVVQQWYYGDPAKGLVPLELWTPVMQDRHRSTYANRELVIGEYEVLGFEGFIKEYGDSLRLAQVRIREKYPKRTSKKRKRIETEADSGNDRGRQRLLPGM